MPKILVRTQYFGSGAYSGAPVDGSFGDPVATGGDYDLNVPGRVREIKAALRFLGSQAATPGLFSSDVATETLYAQLADDDGWEDAAQDEFVLFVSRWQSTFPCTNASYYSVVDGVLVPTMYGLALLALAYRYANASIIAKALPVVACGVGAPSDKHLDLFEQFVVGKVSSAPTIIRDGLAQVAATLPAQVSVHPIPPPDVDAIMYASWQAYQTAISMLWNSTSTSTTEAARSLGAEGLSVTRQERDALAQQIIAKAPARPGQTDLQHVCPKGQSWDDAQGACVSPPAPAPETSEASIFEKIPVWGWLAAATGVLVLFARHKSGAGGGGRKPKRSRRR